MITRQRLLNIWKENTSASPFTSCPASLPVTDKPKIKIGLQFGNTTIVSKQNQYFYENH